MSLSVMPGVVVERVGDDLMVVVPGSTDVVSLSGRPAEVLLDVRAGWKIDSSDPALRDLVDLGIVAAPGLSRRGLIKAGAIGAGAGVAVLAMPGVAVANSNCEVNFFVGVFAMSTGPFWSELWVFLEDGSPEGLAEGLETGHPATWTPLGGDPISLEYVEEVTNPEFLRPGGNVFTISSAALTDLEVPRNDDSGIISDNNMRAGTLRFDFSGCSYTATLSEDD